MNSNTIFELEQELEPIVTMDDEISTLSESKPLKNIETMSNVIHDDIQVIKQAIEANQEG